MPASAQTLFMGQYFLEWLQEPKNNEQSLEDSWFTSASTSISGWCFCTVIMMDSPPQEVCRCVHAMCGLDCLGGSPTRSLRMCACDVWLGSSRWALLQGLSPSPPPFFFFPGSLHSCRIVRAGRPETSGSAVDCLHEWKCASAQSNPKKGDYKRISGLCAVWLCT